MKFEKVEGARAILVAGGSFQEVDVYILHGLYYAKHGGGHVRLNTKNTTSKPKLFWEALSFPNGRTVSADTYGRLCDHSVLGSKALPTSELARQRITKF